ncbi:hypothetical protein B0T20DRAFT_509988 [Sordaria brevicollis]|uniref:Uncharacterized protein n=1 Tax=Sordaria brevicollis TaxID=83679 RepID=A0AAE0P3L4_SORBR|nr:hypothetical protein B0T20DRAFT_509988 [Sordaria brevicollis]
MSKAEQMQQENQYHLDTMHITNTFLLMMSQEKQLMPVPALPEWAVLYEHDDPDLILAGQTETYFGLVSWYNNKPTDVSITTDENTSITTDEKALSPPSRWLRRHLFRFPAPDVRRGPKLHICCGSNTVVCSGKHGVSVSVCKTLVRNGFPLLSEMILRQQPTFHLPRASR